MILVDHLIRPPNARPVSIACTPSRFQVRRIDLTNQQYEGDGLLGSYMQTKRRVGCARTAACHHHARPAGELGVGNCGKTCASLVAASHEIDLIAFVQSVKERKKAFAGYAKCPVDAMRNQRIDRLDRQPEKPCDTISVGRSSPSRRELYRVREIPIQLPRTRIERPGRERPVVDPDHRHDLGEIAGRKDLVRGKEIGIA